MANRRHLAVLSKGVRGWNKWRRENPDIDPDLSGAKLRGWKLRNANLFRTHLRDADLSRADLRGADLHADEGMFAPHAYGMNLTDADLTGADLRRVYFDSKCLLGGARFDGANLEHAIFEDGCLSPALFDLKNPTQLAAPWRYTTFHGSNLSRAILHGNLTADFDGADLSGACLIKSRCEAGAFRGANMRGADLWEVNFSRAHLDGADLRECHAEAANFSSANLMGADLRGADLSRAVFVDCLLRNARLDGARIYGVAVWDNDLANATQADLIVTPKNEPAITCDDLKVAQFVYLLLKNENIRDVIETVGRKAILVLGRFTERREVLEAIRAEIRRLGYLPIVFDFERAADRDFTETVMTLAGISFMVIADITAPRSVPLELQATVPNFMIPFAPLIRQGEKPFSMFQDLFNKHHEWVLPLLEYDHPENLVRVLDEAVITPARERLSQLRRRKARALPARHVNEYLRGPEST